MSDPEIIELVPSVEVEVLETTVIDREVLTTSAEQGPPGPPGQSGTAEFDVDLVLIYQIAKL
ncbi:hypothetical protein [Paludibacterium denitrificans]|uniref:Uncharacterized protein n=1 Tax=Paludibacterium denitrificans TaxID=2675226 RepID=A0A844GE55_9NEIS|nr:hypothetical protein [Paludibacterium denitrificans]MTD33929.1 hypothetical protein [Paludibacterium denitrificans]